MKNQNEIQKVLIGEDGYRVANPFINLPTDTVVLTGRIFEYYNASKNELCLENFRQGILDLLIDKNTIYLVPYYLGSY